MAINVTLGEAKPQESKPFPKLMIGSKGTIIEALEEPNNSGMCICIIRTSKIETLQKDFLLIGGYETFTDYNESITIQNA